MRKIVASIIAFALLTTTVQAATVTTVSDYETGEITISGKIEEARTNKMISLEVKDGQNPAAHISYIETEFDGSYSYTFRMPDWAQTGEYEIRLGAAQMQEPISKKIEHINIGEVNQLILDIKGVVVADSTQAARDAAINALYTVIDGKLKMLNVDDTKYVDISVERRKRIAEEILDERENYGTISDAANKGYAVQVLNVISPDEVVSYLDKYKEFYGLGSATMFAGYEALTDKSRFASIFDTYTFENSANVVKAFNEATFITILEKSQPGEIVNLFANYNSVIPFSLNKYNSLGGETVAFALAGKTIGSMANLEDMINKIGIVVPGPTSSGNGASGFGGGSLGGAVVPVPPQISTSFTDLSGSEWAKEAIDALYGKGIVSGVGDGRYEPTRNVKREEFVKIVLSAFDLDDGNYIDVEFKDVDNSSWAYPYICKAYQLGIVAGVGENVFGMGKFITRQDMAVILYRAAAVGGRTLEKTKDAAEFVDSSNISEYAKVCVDELVRAGIINGFEDGSFRPNDSATRAQSAVMVYNAIK